MMKESNNSKSRLVFAGYGHTAGKFKIKNQDISEAIDKAYLGGFSKSKINSSKNFAAYREQYPDADPFEYFAGHKMGFHSRHHVTPFPPTRKKLYYAETSLDLAVRAVENAIEDSGIHPEKFSAWFLSTVSPHEQAPGMAATLKAHFVRYTNTTPTFTLASGCAGFNVNLERAMEYFLAHPSVEHVVVVHAETMSAFLTNRVKFVPFVTFGDAASAVVISRENLLSDSGLRHVVNYQDQKMLDFVGVDKNWNLHMDDSVIKDRAIINILIAAREVLSLTNWNIDEIDWFIPHQTGNAILFPIADELGIPRSKVYLEEQHNYGNTSGATVAISLSMLNQSKDLKPGTKILSAVAGVGGNYGAFTYEVPDRSSVKPVNVYSNDLKGKTVLLTGASGYLGSAIANKLLEFGANCILHYNTNKPEVPDCYSDRVVYIKADFCNKVEFEKFIQLVDSKEIDYSINAAASIAEHEIVNFYAPFELSKTLLKKNPECILNIGHAAEDIIIPELRDYLGSVSSLHGVFASSSGEYFSKKIRLIHYKPSIMDGGISKQIEPKPLFKFMMSVGQKKPLDVEQTACKIVRSLYIPKVENAQNSYENVMLVRADGYKLEVDI